MAKPERKLFDVRTIDRNVANGVVSKQDYEKHLKQLPDDAANAVSVNIELEDTEIGPETNSADEALE